MSRGQVFTIDISIASLFLVIFSVTTLWFVTYFFEMTLDVEDENQMTFIVKQTYDEILNRLSVEQGVISKEVLDSTSPADLVTELGIQQFDFFLEVQDMKKQRIEPGAYLGSDPAYINEMMIENGRIYAITRPIIYYTGEKKLGVLRFLMWRKRPIVDSVPPALTELSFAANTTLGEPVLISVKADDKWGISNVSINITGPGTAVYEKMFPDFTSGTYRYSFQDTDLLGEYTFRLFGYDSQGNVNDSLTGAFVVEE